MSLLQAGEEKEQEDSVAKGRHPGPAVRSVSACIHIAVPTY